MDRKTSLRENSSNCCRNGNLARAIRRGIRQSRTLYAGASKRWEDGKRTDSSAEGLTTPGWIPATEKLCCAPVRLLVAPPGRLLGGNVQRYERKSSQSSVQSNALKSALKKIYPTHVHRVRLNHGQIHHVPRPAQRHAHKSMSSPRFLRGCASMREQRTSSRIAPATRQGTPEFL